MPTVRCLYFASLSDHFGAAPVTVQVPAGTSLADLRERFANERPAAKAGLSGARIAVNRAFAADESALVRDGDEIAFIPPVSGG